MTGDSNDLYIYTFQITKSNLHLNSIKPIPYKILLFDVIEYVSKNIISKKYGMIWKF